MPKDLLKKIKTGFQNLREDSKENEIIIIWGVAFILLIVLVIVSLFFGGNRSIPVEKQLMMDSTDIFSGGTPDGVVSVGVDAVLSTSTEYNKLPIYEMVEKNYEPSVEAFLLENSVTGLKKHANKHTVTWIGSKGLIEIDLTRSKVYLRFDQGVPLVNVETDLVTEGGAVAHFQNVVARYFDDKFVYGNTSISSPTVNTYRVDANRMIGDFKLYWQTSNGDVDYLLFNRRGDLLEGCLSLVNFNSDNTKSFPLRELDELPETLNAPNSPRAMFYGEREFISGEKYDWSQHNYWLIDEDEQFPEPSVCRATDVELVYYYTGVAFGKITPTYKINCVGSVSFKGGEYEVPAVMFVTAIEPDYIRSSDTNP